MVDSLFLCSESKTPICIRVVSPFILNNWPLFGSRHITLAHPRLFNLKHKSTPQYGFDFPTYRTAMSSALSGVISSCGTLPGPSDSSYEGDTSDRQGGKGGIMMWVYRLEQCWSYLSGSGPKMLCLTWPADENIAIIKNFATWNTSGRCHYHSRSLWQTAICSCRKHAVLQQYCQWNGMNTISQ